MSGKKAKEQQRSQSVIVHEITIKVHANGNVTIDNFPNNFLVCMDIITNVIQALIAFFHRQAQTEKKIVGVSASEVGRFGMH
jgi:hypothetical protein